jgi:hypothetical protein
MLLKQTRIKLLCIILMLVFCQLHIAPTHAAPISCDETLFLNAILTSFSDPTPPPLNWYEMQWEFADAPYYVEYHWANGIAGFTQEVVVKQSGRAVGVATNGKWRVCHPNQGWKRWLTRV